MLNQANMHLIYGDLLVIHKIALKNPKITFKTKVDLFLEISRHIAIILNEDLQTPLQPPSQFNANSGSTSNYDTFYEGQSPESPTKMSLGGLGARGVETLEGRGDRIKSCLRTLLFTMIKLMEQVDFANFDTLNYMLEALLRCSRQLKQYTFYLIKVDPLINFLAGIMKNDQLFDLEDYDDEALNFSLRLQVCDIIFSLTTERFFFRLDSVGELLKLLV
mmetsp:Transcript_16496/g.25479  ORF Transcript_16496/g.25479 Transcript_16496/m.25479 type:complete len:219 (-) Transcript_16496:7093-7749(-)